MYMHFGEWFISQVIDKNPHDEVAVSRAPVVFPELLAGQVPMGVEPMRVAGGEQQLFCAVRFGQLARFYRCSDVFRWRRGSERIALSGTAHRWRSWFVAFEQQGRHLDRSFSTRGFSRGCATLRRPFSGLYF